MNKIKVQFSIKELENFSGIKAHTIRIWEKRYQIFNPNRTETNIRLYSLEELQKLLNVSFLIDYGYKISRISKLSMTDMEKTVNQAYSEKNNYVYSINILKIAMLNFDAILFSQTYNELLKTKSFSQIFMEVFIPFLKEIGMLWQTNSIKPIHEHFISSLIYQKLFENISLAQGKNQIIDTERIFVLFLPENEMHEISLMFINYQLLNKGYRTIYLGAGIPYGDLLEINKFYDNVHYISYFTVMPFAADIDVYLNNFYTDILSKNSSKLYVSGRLAKYVSDALIPSIYKFDSLDELITAI
jgi:DNA-binding transcriptional MerR regulator